jgi:hypothetical protein
MAAWIEQREEGSMQPWSEVPPIGANPATRLVVSADEARGMVEAEAASLDAPVKWPNGCQVTGDVGSGPDQDPRCAACGRGGPRRGSAGLHRGGA